MSSKQFKIGAALVVAILLVTAVGFAGGWFNAGSKTTTSPTVAQTSGKDATVSKAADPDKAVDPDKAAVPAAQVTREEGMAEAVANLPAAETSREAGMSEQEREQEAAGNKPTDELTREAGMSEQEREQEASLKAQGMSEGQMEAAEEYEMLHEMEGYWQDRLRYPTGNFQTAWVVQAARQDSLIERAVPAGKVVYNRANSSSPLGLDPNAFTSLGPKPLQSNGCSGCYSYGKVSGRVNSIAIDPLDPTTAYIAAVGGGIWKTSNCCAITTTWTASTDDPLITSLAVDDVTIDPNNHNVVYAGTGDLNFGSFSMGTAGVLKSGNAGASWSLMGTSVFTAVYTPTLGSYPQYNAIGKVRVDPRNSNNVVAGTKNGVYFSYDTGNSWAGPCYTNNFSTQRQDSTGLILSNNGSSTDIYVAVGARGFSTTVQVNLAENGANGIYKATMPSSGCPTNWSLSSTASNGWPAGTGTGTPVYQGGDVLGRIDLAIAPSNPQVIYAQVQAIQPINGQLRGGQLGVWRTTDGGANWSQRSNVTGLTGCAGDYGQNWYDQGMAVDPNNSDVVYLDTFDIFKSTDGGTTFVDLTCGYAGGNTVHVDQHALAFVPGSSSTLLAGNDGGIYVTNNADVANPAFSQLNETMNAIEFYSGDITGNFATSASPGANAGAQDNGSSVYVWSGQTQGPAMWQLRKGGDGMYARIEPVLNQRWYQESQNGNLAVSTTGPNGALTNATGGWTGDSPRLSFVMPYEIYKYDCPASGCTHMVAGSYRVWETILGAVPASSWYANSPDLTKGTLADRSFINQLSYAVSISTTGIAGTNDGNVWYGFGLGQGTANSANWVNVTGGNSTLPNRPILDVATDPLTPTIGYAAIGGFSQNTPSTPGHLFQVTCTASCASFTWVDKSGNLPNIPADSVIANPNFRQQVFVGTDWGLYYTNNIDAAIPTWLRFNAGLPNVMIWDMAIDRGFTTLALFTRGRGAYAWPLPSGAINLTPVPTNTSGPTSTPLPTLPPGSTATATASSTAVVSPTATTTSTAVVSPTASSTLTATTGTPTATATACNISFSDVPTNNLFYGDIQFLACRNVVNGANGLFRPNANTSRGEFAKIVTLGFGIAAFTPTSPTFVDVAANSIFYGYIEAAAHAGVVNGLTPSQCAALGTPGTCYGPNVSISRAQVAVIIQRAKGYTLFTPTSATFSDVPASSFGYAAIETLAHNNIINGAACGTGLCFRPNDNIKRGELSKVVRRAIETAP